MDHWALDVEALPALEDGEAEVGEARRDGLLDDVVGRNLVGVDLDGGEIVVCDVRGALAERMQATGKETFTTGGPPTPSASRPFWLRAQPL